MFSVSRKLAKILTLSRKRRHLIEILFLYSCCGTDKENLFESQELLKLMINFFNLMTFNLLRIM